MPLFTPQNLNMDTEDGALEKETPFEDIVICSKPFFPNFWAYPPWNQHIPLGEKEKHRLNWGYVGSHRRVVLIQIPSLPCH